MTDDCSECSRHFADNGDLSADMERQRARYTRTLTGAMAALMNVFTYGPLRTVTAGDGEQTGGLDCE
ncbi:hypothetical protein PO909_009083 [Leuciscus waleckii]